MECDMKNIKSSLSILFTSLLLAACGGGSSDSTNTTTPEKPKPQPEPSSYTDGRLVIIDDHPERPELSLYDLKQNKTIHHTQIQYQPSSLYSSPNDRYAVLMMRDQGAVSFYDSGLVTTNGKTIEQSPELLSYQLFGPKPTHFRSFNGQAAIFYDGDDHQSSKFDVFKDVDIGKKVVMSQKLPLSHHGVAEPRGDMVLSSYLPQGSTKLSLVKSYQLHGDHFHEEQSLVNECPGLHGASSIQSYTAFGCEDGVLLVEQKGQNFIDTKLPLTVRIGTLVGNVNAPNLVGLSSATPDLFVIDANQKIVRQLNWVDQANLQRLKQAYSPSGQYFVVLDSAGRLNIFNTKTWEIKFRTPVLNIAADKLAKSQLAMHGQFDEVFINDVENKTILKIDLKTGKIKQKIEFLTVPNQITWVGSDSK